MHSIPPQASGTSSHLYSTSTPTRRALLIAIRIVTNVHAQDGRVVVCGLGKSGHVGRKLAGTPKSLGVSAGFLHAAQAVHGDLGDVRGADLLLFVSFSGRARELLNVLPHVAPKVPVIVLTGHADASTCPLLKGRKVVGSNEGRRGGGEGEEGWDGRGVGVLLPTPIHESEEESFSVGAPTTSATVAMAIGDMLALTVTKRIYGAEKAWIFNRNHPGGAIGAETVAEVAGVAGATVATMARLWVVDREHDES
ncbi:sugar isomerase, KpsF/GutQ [Pyrenophora tritici-repentis Pt-1C-BFP]|uniref:Sugar isomerase, KpsF/GutQ n=1 Tax=Pyrenophora tritici-repentis (strain Pt-1C-BFP) TaxID=426418 RepID=B2WP88_PYRTR|nr:sugar isomerase, KpsF/GutQ [Pyrenophora tritici-repentis Pt-1C-BFP]EDU45954.1 sugar isomerase, KpsF/GutQ [Pyrenophora tritici-repentis Pt-1C-BFP]